LKYRVLADKLAVCQLPAGSRMPEWAMGAGFFCITQTADELSIVCDESRVPAGALAEKDWVALKLEGPFPFSMTGILSSFLEPLAAAQIPIFAVATFDTDYVLMKLEKLGKAIESLSAAGHEMLGSSEAGSESGVRSQ
jgi:uncharacterized protein